MQMRKQTFPRGIHPPEYKSITEDQKLESLEPPKKVFIPLNQHFGKPADPLVKKGEEVLLGQKIGDSEELFSAPVHSSVSGKVLFIKEHPHPLGSPVQTIIIANDGKDTPHQDTKGAQDPFSLKPEDIRKRVRQAGIVGMGGAAFPTAVKLSPPKGKPIDTVIINGCECEPMLTSDYRIMLEYPEDIIKGAQIIRNATGADRILISIEDNKLEAFELFKQKMNGFPGDVALVKTKYPQGAEKNLIYALLNREVPSGGLPFDVGVVVQNVGTVKAVWDVVSSGKPLFERAVTVSGPGIKEKKNLMIRIGTPFQNAIEHCGGFNEGTNMLIMGGPMMGLAQWNLEIPVIKGTSGLIAWKQEAPPKEMPCISCGRCVQHCPMGLVPTQLQNYSRHELYEEADQWGALDCVECGCCQYICPANIPLVHWIRLGKNAVTQMRRKKKSG
ncbi:MAG: electron transport complex subunit RsxC [Candidatus Aminicenantes bacterium]|nr:electron transport complex subunit RsxC [Candidatus Aminicenantes bacterium]